MERETTKHGPLLDEEMKRDQPSVEHGARDEGHHWGHGGPGEEEPDGPEYGAPGTTLSREETEMRREIARSLHRTIFPATRDAILDDARENEAPGPVMRLLASLPDGQTFENVEAIWEALGGRWEQRA